MHVYNDPNLGIPAFLISKLRGVPYVLEVADIWPESLSAGEMVKNQRVLRWVTKLVQFTCQHAAAVVVVSPGFKNNLVKKGIPSEKIRYIPNWGDDSIYRPVEPDLALAEKTGLAGHFNVLYAGNMGVAQGLHAVIEAAEHLRDLPDVQFVFIGDGVEKSDLERMVAEKHLINVRFLDRQSPEKMPDFYALADVLLAHLKQNPLFDITIPSKTLPYLASGRPILMAVVGDAADVVSKAMAGITCEPENPGAIRAAVRQLRAMSPEARQRLGHAGRQAFLKFYARDVLIGTWEQLFVDIALRPR